MFTRRATVLGGAVLAVHAARRAQAAEAVGITATEIKIGNTAMYSGPLSAYSVIPRTEAAFFNMINARGGINGRKINFISLDDGYSPPKTVEQMRRLVEQEGVAFVFNSLGTPTNTAVQRYLNDRKVPQLFVGTGADKWGNYKQFPWTMGWQPSYRIEAQIYAKYILEHRPSAKIGFLYQNDDFGKDYVIGVHEVLGDKFDTMVVKSVTYEPTDPTIDSQIVTLQSFDVDTLIAVIAPKFAVQAIRKMDDIGWKPQIFLTNVSVSVAIVMRPAGPEKAVGVVSTFFVKDPTDPTWDDDSGMKEWRAFMAKHMPGGDLTDINYVFAYGVSMTLLQVLKQCGNDLSRKNVMKQAANLHDLELPILLPGIRINTSPPNYHPIRQMQLGRWNGAAWERFGGLIEGAGA